VEIKRFDRKRKKKQQGNFRWELLFFGKENFLIKVLLEIAKLLRPQKTVDLKKSWYTS